MNRRRERKTHIMSFFRWEIDFPFDLICLFFNDLFLSVFSWSAFLVSKVSREIVYFFILSSFFLWPVNTLLQHNLEIQDQMMVMEMMMVRRERRKSHPWRTWLSMKTGNVMCKRPRDDGRQQENESPRLFLCRLLLQNVYPILKYLGCHTISEETSCRVRLGIVQSFGCTFLSTLTFLLEIFQRPLRRKEGRGRGSKRPAFSYLLMMEQRV